MSEDVAIEEKNPVDNPRKPWLAGLLTIITIGLGHVYTGKLEKDIILFLGACCLAILLSFLLIIIPGLITLTILLIFLLAYLVFCILDAFEKASLIKLSYQLKPFNKWYVYIAFIVIGNLIINPLCLKFIKSNIFQAYKIPSATMKPTLLPGDYAVANKFAYKFNEPEKGEGKGESANDILFI
ncbi:hypothetical protein JXI42_05240 [bacterium]|nr:hypothetical protein [bacterium]